MARLGPRVRKPRSDAREAPFRKCLNQRDRVTMRDPHVGQCFGIERACEGSDTSGVYIDGENAAIGFEAGHRHSRIAHSEANFEHHRKGRIEQVGRSAGGFDGHGIAGEQLVERVVHFRSETASSGVERAHPGRGHHPIVPVANLAVRCGEPVTNLWARYEGARGVRTVYGECQQGPSWRFAPALRGKNRHDERNTTVTITPDRLEVAMSAGQPLAPPRRLPSARSSRVTAFDVSLVVLFITGVTLGLWWRHGGVTQLLAGGNDTWIALAQLTGLAAALTSLGGVLLVARPRWLERRYGLDRMLGWHRWVGTSTVFLVFVHTVVSLIGYGGLEKRGLLPELWNLMQTQQWMWAATAALVLFVLIGISSYRRIRTKVHYETWYFIHLTAYLAVLLGFGHQLTLGTDFVGDKIGTWWWVSLYVVVLAILLVDRFGDLARAFLRRPLRVTAVTYEAPEVASVHIAGPGLKRLRATAGQYFLLRFGHGDLLWQAHPVSLSAAPTNRGLRFTIKSLGDGSDAIHQLPVGTRAYLEGPYGRMTAERSEGEKVLLVGGGVGLAPLRAVVEDCTPDQQPILVARVKNEEDLVHRAEIEQLLAARGGRLFVLAGPRTLFGGGDPFRPDMLREAVPDIAQRHVYLCGPESLERAVEKSARVCGVPLENIHVERFGV